jgi:4-hydroxybenzoate polyprenyltransferase
MTLLRAAHPGPAFAVTLLAGLLGIAVGLGARDVALVVAAVSTGQLVIGWSNDLVDASRDRAVGRTDKPLATGEIDDRTVRGCTVVALLLTVVLSLMTGGVPGPVQLLVVASGLAYNLGLKSTVWSWAPYAVAFGALPAFVSLVDDADALPPWWMVTAGGLLGVGAHLVNVLPDLADDAATGVRGLPHRLGARRSSALAAAVLVAASVVIVLGASVDLPVAVVALVLVGGLAVLALVTEGRTPFRAAIAMALVDVVMLVVAT